MAGAVLRFVIEKPADPIVIETSDDFVFWRHFITFTTTANWVDFVEEGFEGRPHRFFRARVVAP
jgi:hypothetical protein